MKRSKGRNAGQSRNLRSKGRRPITHQLKEWEIGTPVRIDVDPRFKGGIPHLRFNGKSGKVVGRRGPKGYLVEIKDGKAKKQLIVINMHLAKA